MRCEEWEIRIASEDESAIAHIATCESCRRFAAELELNALAMRDEMLPRFKAGEMPPPPPTPTPSPTPTPRP